MEKIKLKICYNGKNFSGFQIQPKKRTVQEELEKTLEFLLKEKVRIFASGRTDAGVSALGQVVHFETSGEVNLTKLLDGLNALLPPDISVTSAERASPDFDARFSVKKKTYMYFFYVSKHTNAVFDDFATRVNDYADLEKMKEACKYLIGTFNFKSFVSRKSGKTNFVRTIYDAKIVEILPNLYAFEITGNGFLYNMVRIIFGTLVMISYSKVEPKDILSIIEGEDRSKAGKTMPAKSLILKNVDYDD